MLIAAAFLDSGYRLAYCADAAVVHSHDLTLRQEYRRNVLIGRFLQEYGERLGNRVRRARACAWCGRCFRSCCEAVIRWNARSLQPTVRHGCWAVVPGRRAGTAGKGGYGMQPTVEILLAAYNGERFLREPAGFAAGTRHGSNGI